MRASKAAARVVTVAALAAGLVAASTDVGAQSPPVPSIVERLHVYLEVYEPKLSELVANEEFVQRMPDVSAVYGEATFFTRRLVSDVGFLRLPGGLAWLGQRSVRTVNGEAVGGGVPRLEDLLMSAGPGVFASAKAIAEANAKYNLGYPRSMNVPTLPLELLGRSHQRAFRARVEGRGTHDGRAIVHVRFSESPPGAIIAFDETRFVRADVVARVAADDGAVLWAEVSLDPPGYGGHRVRVEFAPERALGHLVPVRLSESYSGRSRGEGTASYSNYRKFQTTGRILPPGH